MNNEQNLTIGKRTRMVRPYPIHTLEEALTVAVAIQEVNAGLPFERVLLAKALGTTPSSSGYTLKINSSSKYGLTKGKYNDNIINLTSGGEAIVAPKDDEEEKVALIEAATLPEVFDGFYRMLNKKRLPEDTYAQNMLNRELNIHPELTNECLNIIKSNGVYVGILKEVDGVLNVDIDQAQQSPSLQSVSQMTSDTKVESSANKHVEIQGKDIRDHEVFIGHGGDSNALDVVREIFDEFQILYSDSVTDTEDVNQPISARISNKMQECMAAVIILTNEQEYQRDLISVGRKIEKILYQVGAAYVLYGEKIVILKETGFQPSLMLPGVRIVEFETTKPKDVAFELLKELHKAGIINVSTTRNK